MQQKLVPFSTVLFIAKNLILPPDFLCDGEPTVEPKCLTLASAASRNEFELDSFKSHTPLAGFKHPVTETIKMVADQIEQDAGVQPIVQNASVHTKPVRKFFFFS